MTRRDHHVPAPQDVLASVLAAASQVFGVRVSAADNFFALGGDSVLALELASCLEDLTHADVEIEALFYADDMAHFARYLGSSGRARQEP
jgi:hypothetical protein